MENFQISIVHTYLPLKNLKNQIAKLSNYAVKKVPPYFMNEVKVKWGPVKYNMKLMDLQGQFKHCQLV